MFEDAVVSLLIFIIVYLFIVLEKHHRAVITMLGGSATLFLVFKDPIEALVRYVDFNTIFLLIGMMIFVAVTKRSGLFHFLGLYSVKFSRGNVFFFFLSINFLVALLSSFLDNVTTILVFVPVTLVVCDTVDLDPVPFVISEIISSNIGGTATMIGDPPNIMIASAAKLHFLDFVLNVAPAAVLVFFVVMGFLSIVYRRVIFKKVPTEVVKGFDPRRAIVNKKLFYLSITLTVFVLVLFSLQKVLGLESFEVALFAGFFSLAFLNKEEIEGVLKEIEWGVIFFFIGLFLVVGGLEETGVLEKISALVSRMSGGKMERALISVLGISGISSAFVDNIPFTATMIPVIKKLAILSPENFSDLRPLWWALSLGACLGGNGTLVGASANIIGTSLVADRKHITFWDYFKVGFPVLLISLLVSGVYLLFRY
ncbi:ArsB/NhaD family transporter [Thermotoga sp. RQ2]|uniref:ArsB/NhaD family transporter n=1 Tax=Thermotoga sp. (strain RQ2) TaxID=126740 RepID=UPI00016017B9|nr:ArsB/NhaD family transporter [Thermotoga sp. RQ2]ACB10174.1 Citrate transporter [Thermotoga sp. RQ2]